MELPCLSLRASITSITDAQWAKLDKEWSVREGSDCTTYELGHVHDTFYKGSGDIVGT
jgi:hypothetical protein